MLFTPEDEMHHLRTSIRTSIVGTRGGVRRESLLLGLKRESTLTTSHMQLVAGDLTPEKADSSRETRDNRPGIAETYVYSSFFSSVSLIFFGKLGNSRSRLYRSRFCK